MAIMAGDAGVWPIGPAANPANPAPSVTSPSQFSIGTSLADGFAFMSTNCAKKNSIPSSSARLLIASAAGRAMIVAIPPSPSPGAGRDNFSTLRAELLGGGGRNRRLSRQFGAKHGGNYPIIAASGPGRARGGAASAR